MGEKEEKGKSFTCSSQIRWKIINKSFIGNVINLALHMKQEQGKQHPWVANLFNTKSSNLHTKIQTASKDRHVKLKSSFDAIMFDVEGNQNAFLCSEKRIVTERFLIL